MAGNLPVPNGVEMKIIWGTATTNDAINVLHFRNGSGAAIDTAFAETVWGNVKSAFTGSLLNAQVVPSFQLKSMTLRNMTNNTNPEVPGTTGGVLGSASNATPIPANVSICVSGATALRGKSYHPRCYLWGFSVAAIASTGGIAAAAATACPLFLNQIRTSLAGMPNPLVAVVLSRWTTPPGSPPGTPPTERNPPTMTDISTWLLKDLRFDTQRRRAVPGI